MNSSNIFGRKALFLAVSALALSASGAAFAGTDTANLGVSATVADNCIISASAAVAFGAYDPIVANASSNLDNTGSVDVTCTSGASATVTLGEGANATGTSTAADPDRRMTDSTNFLSYDLFSDSGRSTEWGNTAGTGVSHTGDGTAQTHTVYGSVGQAQNVPAGSYSDTVVATVTF